MDSALRPRDIQARIRAGESPDAVAEAARTTVDKIMPFAGPVMNERAHIAARAQGSSVRRRSGDAGARTLGEAVAAMLRGQNVDPGTVDWDAWRREDGRWTVVGAFSAAHRAGTASFTYDTAGNYVTLDDDDARWLVGEAVPSSPAAAAASGDDLEPARQRRLHALTDDALPLGDDAIELVSGDGPRAVPDPEAPDPEAPDPEAPDPEAPEDETPDETDHETDHETGEEPEPQPKQPTKRRGRASVPSWDEIMFGGGKQD